MKITFVLPGYPYRPIGGFRVVYEYANHLVARGHKVTVVHARRLPNWSPPPPQIFIVDYVGRLGKQLTQFSE